MVMKKAGPVKPVGLYGYRVATGNWEPISEIGGGLGVDLVTIAGVVPQMDDGDKLAVSVYGRAAVAGDTPLNTNPSGDVVMAVDSDVPTDDTRTTVIALRDKNDALKQVLFYTWPLSWDGSQGNRQRPNIEEVLLASAARTVLTNSPDQVNYNHRGMILIIDVTARAVATTLTPSITVKDPIGGDYHTIWTAAAAINTGNGSFFYLFYPSPLADAAELYTEAIDLTLGRTWRATVNPSDANSVTYSVASAMIL